MTTKTRLWCIAVFVCFLTVDSECFAAEVTDSGAQSPQLQAPQLPGYRGPVDLALLGSEWMATANELSDSVSLIRLRDDQVTDELVVPARPSSIVAFSDDEFLVTSRFAGTVSRIRVKGGKLENVAEIAVGAEPMGIAAMGSRAFVAVRGAGEVVEIDLEKDQIVSRFEVGRWPTHLALSPDGKRLAVGLNGDSAIAVCDTDSQEVLYQERLSGGINIGHLKVAADGVQIHFPWMVYRSNPITVGNIRQGWVLASRVAKVRFDGPEYRQAISLDVPRKAVADPHGLVITPNQERMVVSSSGTHELLVYRLADTPFIGAGGPGDLIDPQLLRDDDRFFRIETGGRPMGMLAARDSSRYVWVANHLLDSVQLVDLSGRAVVKGISVGSPPDSELAVRQHLGMEIFYDAQRSLDQWYSCHSCHQDGASNSKPMDTWNDGSELTAKSVPSLVGVESTGPWTWHGWQDDLDASLQNSFTSTMKGEEATEEEIAALRSYLQSLSSPPTPNSVAEEQLLQGKMVFEREDIGCAQCHSGAKFTDGEIHDVGLAGRRDRYEGYNTPSLLGVSRKNRLLHDGRARTVTDVITRWHKPEEIGGGAELSDAELAALVRYVESL